LNVHGFDVIHFAVVAEMIAAPVSALIARPNVTESIINAAVVADMAAPITIVIAIPAADVSPVSGRPK
jgi:hypothetical protein